MNPAIVHCLHADPRAVADQPAIADWWPVHLALSQAWAEPAARAIASGFAADRVAWAFAGGYQAALRALLPELPHETLAAFCVTEADGNRPRDIRSTVQALPDGGWRLDGAKRWATLGPGASQLLVVAALDGPSADGPHVDAPGVDMPARPRLQLLRVPVPSAGLEITAMPATRFVPEVPHAALRLDGVRLPSHALLPGDGYARYVKPFRTLEDLHVTLAVLAYLLREARARDWPADFREPLVACLCLLATLAADDTGTPACHVALAGALHLAHGLYDRAQPLWAACAEDRAAQRWQRDAALFAVAGTARQQRAAIAWQRLAPGGFKAAPDPSA